MTLLLASGCVGYVSELVFKPLGCHEITSACNFDLTRKNIAVICLRNEEIGNDATTRLIEEKVSAILKSEFKQCEMVNYREFPDSIANNKSGKVDVTTIGRALNANIIISIDFDSLACDGAHGKARYSLRLFDLERRDSQSLIWVDLDCEFSLSSSGGGDRDDLLVELSRKIAERFIPSE